MTLIFLKEIDLLKEMILRLAVDVEDRMVRAVQAVQQRDEVGAREIIEHDTEIDAREVRIEEECLKVLALHQPVATDLRFVVFVLKVDNDLERIADIAVNIAKRVPHLARSAAVDIESRIEQIADAASSMLRQTIDAVVNLDAEAGGAICAQDRAVDAIHRDVHQIVLERLTKSGGGQDAAALLALLAVSKELERAADHVTNIAEDLIYLVEGKVVRHRIDKVTGAVEPQ